MPRDPRVDKLQRLRQERTTRAPGGYYGTRAVAGSNVRGGPRRRDTGRTLLSLVLFVALLGGGLYGAGQFLVHGLRTSASAQDRASTVTVTVASGEGMAHLATRLQADGLIFNATIFNWYLRLSGSGSNVIAGPHTLRTGMNMDEVVKALAQAPAVAPTVVITTFPGQRAEEIAQTLASNHVASYADVMHEVLRGTFSTHDYPFLADRPAGASIEGYLLPDTYAFPLHISAHDAVARLLRNFGAKVSASAIAQGKKLYGSFYKAVILASIVEREAGTNNDRPLIASVYANRLLRDPNLSFTRLGADPTIQYAVGKPGNWWPQLSQADLRIVSPFNTYTHAGLPPLPIAEPSVESIAAAANPPSTSYYFFWHRNGSLGKSIFCTVAQGSQCAGTPQ